MTNLCPEKTALLLAYSDAVRRYSEAVKKLHDGHGTVSKHEAGQLVATADEHRVTSENARLEMATPP